MNALIISESFIVRDALSVFFKRKLDFENVYMAPNFTNLKDIELESINFMILDIEPNISYNVYKIRDDFKNTKLLVFDRNNNKELFFDFLKNDVDGYIVERVNENDIVYIVSKLLSNEKYYGAELLHMVMANSIHQSISEDLNTLSYRETEVFKKLKKGYSNKEIAEELYVTEHTIKKHITSILAKLNVKNRKELIYSVRHKVI